MFLLVLVSLVYAVDYGSGNYGEDIYSGVDTDGDGLLDISDPLFYNETNVTVSGITNLNITIGENTTTGSHSGINEVAFYDQTTKILNFTHNFASSNLDLSKVKIIKATNSIIVNLSSQVQANYNKTLHITDNSFIALCVKDTEIASISEMTSACNGDNETDFTSCLGNNTGITINSTTCIDQGSIISVSNLRYSAIRGTPTTTTTEITSSGGGGASAAGGGGAISIKKPECTEDSDCKQNQYCFEEKCHDAECFDDSVCNTDQGETCFQHRCVKLFDMEILEFESPVKIGEFFDFTYFVKAVAEINGDVEIKFWIEKDKNIITSGQDTIYFKGYEEKTKTKKLFLPEDISSGTYTFYIEVTYGKYTASAHRTIGIKVKDGMATIEIPAQTSNMKDYIIYGLIVIIVLILIYILYLQKKKIIKRIVKTGKNIKKDIFKILIPLLIITIITLAYYLGLHKQITNWIPKTILWCKQNLVPHLILYWHYILTIIVLLIIIKLILSRKRPKKIKRKRRHYTKPKKRISKNKKRPSSKRLAKKVDLYWKRESKRLEKRKRAIRERVRNKIRKEKQIYKLRKRIKKIRNK